MDKQKKLQDLSNLQSGPLQTYKVTIDNKSTDVHKKDEVDSFVGQVVNDNEILVNTVLNERDKLLVELEKCATMLEETANKIRTNLL